MKTILIVVIVIVLLIAACYATYKTTEIHELHKMRAAFEHYLDAHPLMNEGFKNGIERAEHIVDEEEEKVKHEIFG